MISPSPMKSPDRDAADDIIERLREWQNTFVPAGVCRPGMTAVFGEAASELATLRRRVAWQPIETAPRDGSWFLAYSPRGDWCRISWGRNRRDQQCWCSVDYWWLDGELRFTHWVPLLEPPSSPLPPGRNEG